MRSWAGEWELSLKRREDSAGGNAVSSPTASIELGPSVPFPLRRCDVNLPTN